VARFAIAYASSEGHTRRVSDEVADTIRGHGHLVSVCDVSDPAATASVAAADAVVLAASIHNGRVQPRMLRFASAQGVALSERPGALMIVSMTAASPRAAVRARLDAYLASFLTCTPWRPDVVEYVAGALRPSRLGPIRRTLASRLARQLGVQTEHDLECTDWTAVHRFAGTVARWFPRVGVPTRAPRPRAGATSGRA
jgi:menaquinone-dependent protoporphyrinogen oxidase